MTLVALVAPVASPVKGAKKALFSMQPLGPVLVLVRALALVLVLALNLALVLVRC